MLHGGLLSDTHIFLLPHAHMQTSMNSQAMGVQQIVLMGVVSRYEEDEVLTQLILDFTLFLTSILSIQYFIQQCCILFII